MVQQHLLGQSLRWSDLDRAIARQVAVHQCGDGGVRIEHQDRRLQGRPVGICQAGDVQGLEHFGFGQRETETKGRAITLLALDPDASAVRLHKPLADGEAQSGTALAAA